MAEEEDRFGRFLRNTGIDLHAEIASGGSEGGLDNYYTKTQSDSITDPLDSRITDLEESPGGGGGVTDHGDLTGLSDDDHTQYHTDARGDARYYTKAQVDSSLSGKSDTTHNHDSRYYTETEVDTLLTGKQASDADLTALAGIAPNNDDIIQRKAGAWTNRTPAQVKTDLALAKADVGLGNVDNTSDASKPVSTATQTALDGKAATSHTHNASDVNAGTLNIARIPTGSTSTTVPLGDHTHDSRYYTETETDALLGAKAAITVTDALDVRIDNLEAVTLDQDLTDIGALTPTNNDVLQRKAGVWTNRTPAQLKTDLSLVKADVGLGNVDNTADTAKPISTATQTALDGKQALDSDLTAIAALTPTNDDFVQRKSGAWTNRSVAQVKTDLAINNLDNTSDVNKPVSSATQTALNAKAAIAGPTFTGTVTAPRVINPPVALTDAATIATDASLGNLFRVTLAGNRTLGVPTNPTDGQRVVWEVSQDATGTRTLALASGAGGFIFGTDIASITLTTTASKTDFIGAIYNSTANRWRVIAFVKGY